MEQLRNMDMEAEDLEHTSESSFHCEHEGSLASDSVRVAGVREREREIERERERERLIPRPNEKRERESERQRCRERERERGGEVAVRRGGRDVKGGIIDVVWCGGGSGM